jgi:hypothetical protein
MAQELLAGGRKKGAAFVADKKRPSKLLFQIADSRAHGRLGNIQAFRSLDKASCRDDLNKSTSELDVHTLQMVAFKLLLNSNHIPLRNK